MWDGVELFYGATWKKEIVWKKTRKEDTGGSIGATFLGREI